LEMKIVAKDKVIVEKESMIASMEVSLGDLRIR
jgi:hypothetical protein